MPYLIVRKSGLCILCGKSGNKIVSFPVCLHTTQLQGMVGALLPSVPIPSPPCPSIHHLPPTEGGMNPRDIYCTMIYK